MKRTPTFLAVTALACTLTTVGCGGDDDDAGEPLSSDKSVGHPNAPSERGSAAKDSAPSKEEFVARANEICAQGNTKLQAAAQERLGEGMAPAADRDAFATETIVPNVRGQIDDIGALDVPKRDEDTVNAFLHEAERILDRLERAPESFSADPFVQVNQDFAAYGLTACGPPVGG